MKIRKAKCPLCSETLIRTDIQYIFKHTTHIYKCPDCPFVGLEYYTENDLEDLVRNLRTK